MTFETIFENYGTISKARAIYQITELGNLLFGENRWKLVPDTCDSETKPEFLEENGKYIPTPRFLIGSQYLEYKIDNGRPLDCSFAGYVLTIDSMFHEYRHNYQLKQQFESDAFSLIKPDNTLMTDIARRRLITTFFPEIYYNTYYGDPGELDAETKCTGYTLNYFEKQLNRKGYDNVRQLLYEVKTLENTDHYTGLDDPKIRSIDNVIFVLARDCKKAAAKDYSLTEPNENAKKGPMILGFSLTEKFLTDPQYRQYREMYDKLENGILKDKLLMQVIVQEYSDVNAIWPRLDGELRLCRQLSGSQVKGSVEKIPVNPRLIVTLKSVKPEIDERKQGDLSDFDSLGHALDQMEKENDKMLKL